MTELQVFDISDVAAILAMPVTRVKNWTIGRPLTIKPSIRTARGKGTRNLYGREEIYLMGLANHLVNDGFALDAVKGVVTQMKKHGRFPPKDAAYLLMFRPKRGLVTQRARVQVVSKETDLARAVTAQPDSISLYVCDLGKLTKQIDEAAQEHEVWSVVPSGKSKRSSSKKEKRAIHVSLQTR